MGYHMAGFDVVGVDIVDQPNYPFEFHRMDALKVKAKHIVQKFDAVHASPPCQAFTVLRNAWVYAEGHEPLNLIPGTRELLEDTELPWLMENVPGAPLSNPLQLCGSAFGLRVRRHRMFETSGFEAVGITCNHQWQDRHRVYPYKAPDRDGSGYRKLKWTGVVPVYGSSNQLDGGGDTFYAAVAMGIDWVTRKEMAQMIPPVYTMYLGHQLIAQL